MEVSPPSGGRRSTRELRATIFREAAAIVEREFAAHITVEEVAPRVASSPRQLRRAFAEAAGMSFRSYLGTVRTNRAAELLASTDLAVKDIARRVGYLEASALTRAFRRNHGVSPSAFRRMSRSDSG
ncbi:MAG: helix-turn-helix transcriptional regulator [Actinomycetota bacterium]|nr:helix-turn-helix transcriptional regulator [Actinomycetota bacterium]